MFRAARIYIQRNLKTGKTEWFFKAREGHFGPFSSKDIAKQALNVFITQCIEKGSDGGRDSDKETSKLSGEPSGHSVSKHRQ
jgi:hypothetical protein